MDKVIKVAHVIHGLPRGGLENGVVNVVNKLPKNQFQQQIYCLDQLGEMADRVDQGVDIALLDRRRYDFILPFKLARKFKKEKPDIIHCRNWNSWLDTAVARSLSGHKTVLVWSFHGFADGNNFPARRRLASRWLAGLTDKLFAVCSDSADRFASFTNISRERFDVIYNGVDCDRFCPSNSKNEVRKSLSLSTRKIIVSTVASFTPVKDHLSLLRAIKKFIDQVKNCEVQFLFIGDGPLKPQIIDTINQYQLQNFVELVGNKDNIQDYLTASDIFFLPSRLEGMSNAILEAMACGLPVIAKSVGGNIELIENEKTGILCDPKEINSMVGAITRLVGSGRLREEMGRKARERAVKNFSISTMIDSYKQYYTDIVNDIK